MRRTFDDVFSAIWNGFGQLLGVLASYYVKLPRHDERWSFYLAKIIHAIVGLCLLHRYDLRVGYRPMSRVWRIAPVKSGGRRYISIKDGFVNETVHIVIRSDRDKSPEAPRMVHGEIEPNNATIAPANDIHPINTQTIKKCQHIVRHQCVADRHVRIS